MKIWLPDDNAQVAVDTDKEGNCTVYKQRVTLVLKPIAPPKGFENEEGAK